jgi:filamentous hemagglutinin family protein
MKNVTNTFCQNFFLQALVLVWLTPGLILHPVHVSANPTDGVVVIGEVNFHGMGTANLDINNLSQHAIINWQNFSIGAGEVTTINQAANAHTLNRVISSNPTEIYGMLKAAQGGVTVINSNGIMVGESGVVDIAGLMTMSTLDISNNDFLNGGSNNFKGDSSAGIRNYGSISSQNGDVVLLGNFLQNAGSVSAPDGTVAFGAGGDMIVDQAGGGVISVRGGGPGGETGIENTGSINAAGAELKAHGNVYALAIKNDGLVRASGYNFKGGRLTLSGGSNGNIVNNGQLQARNRDGSGGQVEIAGGRVQLAAGSSTDAAGELGRNGGSVSVAGSDVIVGQGAAVTTAGATGGAVSIVGTNSAVVNGSVDARGEFGKGGRIDATADSVTIGSTATLNTSGYTGGGQMRVGGGFQGKDAEVANADNLTVEEGALIISDAEGTGTGGNIILWSDGDTLFAGEVSARGIDGGGFAEISGKSTLEVVGKVDLTTVGGKAGTAVAGSDQHRYLLGWGKRSRWQHDQ